MQRERDNNGKTATRRLQQGDFENPNAETAMEPLRTHLVTAPPTVDGV